MPTVVSTVRSSSSESVAFFNKPSATLTFNTTSSLVVNVRSSVIGATLLILIVTVPTLADNALSASFALKVNVIGVAIFVISCTYVKVPLALKINDV